MSFLFEAHKFSFSQLGLESKSLNICAWSNYIHLVQLEPASSHHILSRASCRGSTIEPSG